jgi:hypothetical protein
MESDWGKGLRAGYGITKKSEQQPFLVKISSCILQVLATSGVVAFRAIPWFSLSARPRCDCSRLTC